MSHSNAEGKGHLKFNKNCHEKKYFLNRTSSIWLTLTHNTSQAAAETVCLQK